MGDWCVLVGVRSHDLGQQGSDRAIFEQVRAAVEGGSSLPFDTAARELLFRGINETVGVAILRGGSQVWNREGEEFVLRRASKLGRICARIAAAIWTRPGVGGRV